jgi:hypothetical protein
MSTINWVYETKPVTPPFRQTIDMAAMWLRNIGKVGRSLGGWRVGALSRLRVPFSIVWRRVATICIPRRRSTPYEGAQRYANLIPAGRLHGNEQHWTSDLGDRRNNRNPPMRQHAHTWVDNLRPLITAFDGSRTIVDAAEVIHAEDPVAPMRSFSRSDSCSKSNMEIRR